MKTLVTLAVTLVLTASLLMGCGCTNRNNDNTSAPTVLPTNEELWDSTEATTRATTMPTTTDSSTDAAGGMNGSGNGGMDNSTGSGGTMSGASGENGGSMDSTTGTTTETEGALSRSARRMMPGSR